MGIIKIIYLIIMPILFLTIAILFYKMKPQEKFFPLFFTFSISALVYLFMLSWGPGDTIENKVFSIFLTTIIVVVSIIVSTRIIGDDLASIYLKKGNLQLGLIIGLFTFLIFLITAIPASIWIFGGQEMSTERLIYLAPWILAFIFLNAIREELLFRAFFLKKYEEFLEPDNSNLLQALIFSLAHIYVPFNSFLPIYLILTFFLGLAFGALMQKTDSILVSILFHAGADIPVILAVFSVL
jgi:membrane protease YdiL (CAAX protease family)